jgi:hypothetical protein
VPVGWFLGLIGPAVGPCVRGEIELGWCEGVCAGVLRLMGEGEGGDCAGGLFIGGGLFTGGGLFIGGGLFKSSGNSILCCELGMIGG